MKQSENLYQQIAKKLYRQKFNKDLDERLDELREEYGSNVGKVIWEIDVVIEEARQ
jgi:hypothetical protein